MTLYAYTVVGRWQRWAAAGYATAGLVKSAEQGRIAAQSDQAQERRAETQRRHRSAKANWRDSDLPDWLDKDFYTRKIQPLLKGITLSVLAARLGISIPYAVDIRAGRRVPHPRHWQTLAQLVGVSSASEFPILYSD
jgi:hypothetical protein